jgi:hypothetical protein
LRGRRATERAVDAIRVVIVLVFLQLARQVHGVPEKYPIKVLTPFDERMRDRSAKYLVADLTLGLGTVVHDRHHALDPAEIWEAPFSALLERLAPPASRARARGVLSVSDFKRIGRRVFSLQAISMRQPTTGNAHMK